jgi:hypothetical protein
MESRIAAYTIKEHIKVDAKRFHEYFIVEYAAVYPSIQIQRTKLWHTHGYNAQYSKLLALIDGLNPCRISGSWINGEGSMCQVCLAQSFGIIQAARPVVTLCFLCSATTPRLMISPAFRDVHLSGVYVVCKVGPLKKCRI